MPKSLESLKQMDRLGSFWTHLVAQMNPIRKKGLGRTHDGICFCNSSKPRKHSLRDHKKGMN